MSRNKVVSIYTKLEKPDDTATAKSNDEVAHTNHVSADGSSGDNLIPLAIAQKGPIYNGANGFSRVTVVDDGHERRIDQDPHLLARVVLLNVNAIRNWWMSFLGDALRMPPNLSKEALRKLLTYSEEDYESDTLIEYAVDVFTTTVPKFYAADGAADDLVSGMVQQVADHMECGTREPLSEVADIVFALYCSPAVSEQAGYAAILDETLDEIAKLFSLIEKDGHEYHDYRLLGMTVRRHVVTRLRKLQ